MISCKINKRERPWSNYQGKTLTDLGGSLLFITGGHEDSYMKICIRCKKSKQECEYYVHKKMSSGFLNKCKSCCKEQNNANRKNNIEHYREYDVDRYYDNGPRDSNRNKESVRIARRRWDKKNRHKKYAHQKVKRAVDKGILIKPNSCSMCSDSGVPIEGHHSDYDKPLDVMWLCRTCHGRQHRKEEHYNK